MSDQNPNPLLPKQPIVVAKVLFDPSEVKDPTTFEEDVHEMREYHENKTPRWFEDWRYAASVAAVMAALALLIFAVLVVIQRRDDRAQISTFTAQSECRARVNASAASASFDVDLARGNLIITQAKATLAQYKRQPIDQLAADFETQIPQLEVAEANLRVAKADLDKLIQICGEGKDK